MTCQIHKTCSFLFSRDIIISESQETKTPNRFLGGPSFFFFYEWMCHKVNRSDYILSWQLPKPTMTFFHSTLYPNPVLETSDQPSSTIQSSLLSCCQYSHVINPHDQSNPAVLMIIYALTLFSHNIHTVFFFGVCQPVYIKPTNNPSVKSKDLF